MGSGFPFAKKAQGHRYCNEPFRTPCFGCFLTRPQSVHSSELCRFVLYGRTFEVATFRSDHAYLDGRHPSSVTYSGPEQDALRRDFTVNGLFYDPIARRVIDFVHGKNDIQSKVLRTIGDPFEPRFAEDKLRILRAVRLACELGFTIVPESWNALLNLPRKSCRSAGREFAMKR